MSVCALLVDQVAKIPEVDAKDAQTRMPKAEGREAGVDEDTSFTSMLLSPSLARRYRRVFSLFITVKVVASLLWLFRCLGRKFTDKAVAKL